MRSEERLWVREVQNTLSFVLGVAFKKVTGKRVFIVHSFSDGFWCHGDDSETHSYAIEEDVIHKVKMKMEELIKDENRILKIDMLDRATVEAKFLEDGDLDRLEVLHKWMCDPVPVIRLGEDWDYTIGDGYCVDKTSLFPHDLTVLKVDSGLDDSEKVNVGFVLRCPTHYFCKDIPPFVNDISFFKFAMQRSTWRNVVNLNTLRDLNVQIREKRIQRTIWILESLHEKDLSKIAETLCHNFDSGKRIILIAGPSSAGKTTFAKRLDIHLGVNGYSSICFGLDDFYKEISEEESKTTNFESIDAFEIKDLIAQVDDLLNGKEIAPRRYNFKKRRAEHDTKHPVTLQDRQFIVIEGIQCLNPVISGSIGKDRVQKIFINTSSYISIDSGHRISSSDVRLLRRLVRDYKFRKYTVDDTLSRWNDVRLNEEEQIFPFQNEADLSFNTSLVYEMSVLSSFAAGILAKFILIHGAGLEKGSPTLAIAKRLFVLISFFETTTDKYVPGTSILKEFFGGSFFEY